MNSEDLEQQLKSAALAKLQAETEKLTAETQALRKPSSLFNKFADLKEVLTLVAGLAGAVGGGWALWTGIDLATEKKKNIELETRQLNEESEKAQQHLADLTERDQQLTRQIKVGDSTLLAAKKQSESLGQHSSSISAYMDSIRTLVRRANCPAGQTNRVERYLAAVEKNLDDTKTNAGFLSTNLQEATTPQPLMPPPPAATSGMKQQVQQLFAPVPGDRGHAYQQLIAVYATTPGLVPALLAQARADSLNLNGIYNTLVVLTHLEPQPTGADKQAIAQFAIDIRKQDLGKRINERVVQLQQQLGLGK